MIYKNTPGWLRAVNGNTLTDIFSSAWANIVNSLDGIWGQSVVEFEDKDIVYKLVKSDFTASFFTSTVGDITIEIPFEPSSDSIVDVLYYDTNNEVTTQNKYIIETRTITLTLGEGNKLIKLNGTCRRL